MGIISSNSISLISIFWRLILGPSLLAMLDLLAGTIFSMLSSRLIKCLDKGACSSNNW